MLPFAAKTRFFPSAVLLLGLLLAHIPTKFCAKVWFLTTASSAPELDETDSGDSEDINWLIDVVQRDPFLKQEASDTDTASRSKDRDKGAEDIALEDERVYTVDRSPHKNHKEYHVHYHTHQHLVARDRKYTMDSPSNMRLNVHHRPVVNSNFKPHLAGFKDFETLLKKNQGIRFNEFAPSERYRSYRPHQLGILDSPGGSPKARENIPVFVTGESRNSTRVVNRHYGRLKLPPIEPPPLNKNQLINLKNLRKVGNMSGWLVYSWS